MTWEELKEKAKEMGYKENQSQITENGKTVATESICKENIEIYNNGFVLGRNVCFEQLLRIMEALK